MIRFYERSLQMRYRCFVEDPIALLLSEEAEFLSFLYDGAAALWTHGSTAVISDLALHKPFPVECEAPIEEDSTAIYLKHH